MTRWLRAAFKSYLPLGAGDIQPSSDSQLPFTGATPNSDKLEHEMKTKEIEARKGLRPAHSSYPVWLLQLITTSCKPREPRKRCRCCGTSRHVSRRGRPSTRRSRSSKCRSRGLNAHSVHGGLGRQFFLLICRPRRRIHLKLPLNIPVSFSVFAPSTKRTPDQQPTVSRKTIRPTWPKAWAPRPHAPCSGCPA